MEQLTIDIDSRLKKNFLDVCSALELSVSDVITMCAENIVDNQKLPFDAFYSVSNIKALKESIKQAEEGKVITKTIDELLAMEDNSDGQDHIY